MCGMVSVACLLIDILLFKNATRYLQVDTPRTSLLQHITKLTLFFATVILVSLWFSIQLVPLIQRLFWEVTMMS